MISFHSSLCVHSLATSTASPSSPHLSSSFFFVFNLTEPSGAAGGSLNLLFHRQRSDHRNGGLGRHWSDTEQMGLLYRNGIQNFDSIIFKVKVAHNHNLN